MGVEASEEDRPHPEKEEEAQAQEGEKPEEDLPGPGAEEGKEGSPCQGYHDGGNRGDEPGAVGRLQGEAQSVKTRYPTRRPRRRARGAPRTKRPRASLGRPATSRLARPKRRRARGKVG